MTGYCIGVGIALFCIGAYYIFKHLRKKWNNKKNDDRKEKSD